MLSPRTDCNPAGWEGAGGSDSFLDTGALIAGKAVGDSSSDKVLDQREPYSQGARRVGTFDQAEDPAASER